MLTRRQAYPVAFLIITVAVMVFALYQYQRAELLKRAMLRQTLQVMEVIQGTAVPDNVRMALYNSVVGILLESYRSVRGPFFIDFSGTEAGLGQNVCSEAIKDACRYAKDEPDSALFINNYCQQCQ